MSDKKFKLMSDHDNTTQAGTKRKDEKGYSWSQYRGSKESHDVEVNQMNSKNFDGEKGEHIYYCPKTGHQGGKGSNSPRKNG